MSEIEYESNNKAITDKYCNKVIDHKPIIRSVKKLRVVKPGYQ